MRIRIRSIFFILQKKLQMQHPESSILIWKNDPGTSLRLIQFDCTWIRSGFALPPSSIRKREGRGNFTDTFYSFFLWRLNAPLSNQNK